MRDSSSLQLGLASSPGLCLIIQVRHSVSVSASSLPPKKKVFWQWHEQSHIFVCSLVLPTVVCPDCSSLQRGRALPCQCLGILGAHGYCFMAAHFGDSRFCPCMVQRQVCCFLGPWSPGCPGLMLLLTQGNEVLGMPCACLARAPPQNPLPVVTGV